MAFNTFAQQKRVDARLQEQQEINLKALTAHITKEQGKVVRVYRKNSGWGDGFTLYHFDVKPNWYSFKTLQFSGNDNNSAYMKHYPSGGRGSCGTAIAGYHGNMGQTCDGASCDNCPDK